MTKASNFSVNRNGRNRRGRGGPPVSSGETRGSSPVAGSSDSMAISYCLVQIDGERRRWDVGTQVSGRSLPISSLRIETETGMKKIILVGAIALLAACGSSARTLVGEQGRQHLGARRHKRRTIRDDVDLGV